MKLCIYIIVFVLGVEAGVMIMGMAYVYTVGRNKRPIHIGQTEGVVKIVIPDEIGANIFFDSCVQSGSLNDTINRQSVITVIPIVKFQIEEGKDSAYFGRILNIDSVPTFERLYFANGLTAKDTTIWYK